MPTKKPSKAKAADVFKCEYCGRALKYEATFLKHVCERKRRYLQRDEKPVRIGFMIFEKFWRWQTKARRSRTFDDFATSRWYPVMVAFGKYLHDLNAIRPDDFVDFLIKTEVPVDKWQSPTVYQRYVRELTKKETPLAAVERNFLLMQQWSLDTKESWVDFFRKVPTTLATMWIISGRISPWLLYVAPSAHCLMERFNEEQITMVSDSLDPKFWAVKLKNHSTDVDLIREQLLEVGL